ncbi:MAG: GTPase, partial [Pirellulales bacterium]
ADAERAVELLEAIVRYGTLGRHLTQPWRVVLTGRPNVGKSSLINQLLGYRRALVYPQPGTTRDVLTAVTAVDGWPIELADTAGQRTATDPIEAAGIRRADDRLSRADVVVIVFDASQPLVTDDRRLMARHASALHAYNKIDLAGESTVPAGAIGTSAISGEGINRLVAAIAERLVPNVPPVGAAVPFDRRQVDLLHQTLDAVRMGRPAAALTILQSL